MERRRHQCLSPPLSLLRVSTTRLNSRSHPEILNTMLRSRRIYAQHNQPHHHPHANSFHPATPHEVKKYLMYLQHPDPCLRPQNFRHTPEPLQYPTTAVPRIKLRRLPGVCHHCPIYTGYNPPPKRHQQSFRGSVRVRVIRTFRSRPPQTAKTYATRARAEAGGSGSFESNLSSNKRKTATKEKGHGLHRLQHYCTLQKCAWYCCCCSAQRKG